MLANAGARIRETSSGVWTEEHTQLNDPHAVAVPEADGFWLAAAMSQAFNNRKTRASARVPARASSPTETPLSIKRLLLLAAPVPVGAAAAISNGPLGLVTLLLPRSTTRKEREVSKGASGSGQAAPPRSRSNAHLSSTQSDEQRRPA